MNPDNETLEEKYSRLCNFVLEYTVKVDSMLSDVSKVSEEDLRKVLKELEEMHDEAEQAEKELLILHKMMGKND